MKSTIPTSRIAKCLLLAGCSIAFPAISSAQTPAEGDAPAAVDYRPEKFSPGKYRRTFANSAFEREILPPAKVDNTPPPTPFDLKVVGVTGQEGQYRVTLIDKKGKYQVVTDDASGNGDGYRYAGIEPAANIADFRVEIVKDGQTEWAEFDDKRFSIASKGAAPKKPSARGGRPNVVPTTRTLPPRAPIPQSKTSKTANQKAGQAAIKTINAANAEATATAAGAAAKSKSRVSGRRVVLPPKSR
ncbi:MAG: hypothetical protein ACI8XO_001364 [Verrucomicrobiales bacterium]|jgi:hypothetical protein